MVNHRQLWGGLANSMFQMAYIYAQVRCGKIPDIYLQDEWYFEEYKEEIKQLYRQGIGEPIDMVAIHVRRTDYVDNPFYVDLSTTPYYEDAMALFPKEDFLVFSDDVEWCKKQPIFKRCEFSCETDEIKDMNLMASCKSIIMANSSFSWWASYISPYAQKIIAPNNKLWYSDGIERTKCPSEWIRL